MRKRRKQHYTCVSFARDKAEPGCQEDILAKRGDRATLRASGWAPAGPSSDMWKCSACKVGPKRAATQKPSIGRILHYNVEDIGWRPMIVTSVGGPTRAIDGSMNPVYVSGWAKLDPADLPAAQQARIYNYGMQGILVPHEVPVVNVFEGEGPNSWRWPPRSN